jgi:hypothetical protein
LTVLQYVWSADAMNNPDANVEEEQAKKELALTQVCLAMESLRNVLKANAGMHACNLC